MACTAVSIPFPSGLILNPFDHGHRDGLRGLNPFSFRANTELQAAEDWAAIVGLNPFSFRANTEPGVVGRGATDNRVSIPFPSGLILNKANLMPSRALMVSIPFPSGLILNGGGGGGLPPHGIVSIPFPSGLIL